jgi:hypothetical protein
MGKEMTAVEWFANKVLLYKNPTNINGTDYIVIPINKIEHLQEKAKEMAKEQIIKAHLAGANSSEDFDGETEIEYYNETYGGNK